MKVHRVSTSGFSGHCGPFRDTLDQCPNTDQNSGIDSSEIHLNKDPLCPSMSIPCELPIFEKYPNSPYFKKPLCTMVHNATMQLGGTQR